MSGNVPASGERDLFRIVRGIRDLFEGRSNAVGSLTLAANAATTTVTAQNCGAACKIFAFPTTANAAAEIGNGTMYIGTVSAGSFVVTHANNAQVDRTFFYVALG
jgi:hypothetical protein